MCVQYVHVHGCVHVHIYTLTLYTCTCIHVYVKPTCTCTCTCTCVFIHKVQYKHMYLNHVEGNEACMVHTMYANVSSTCILKGTCTRHLVKHINFDIVTGTCNLVVVCHSAPCLSKAR